MIRLIIFDKDHTLVESACEEGFIQHPKDQRILPGADEAVHSFHESGCKLAIVSNQGGVEGGKKSLESAIQEMGFCLELFPPIKIGLFCSCEGGEWAWAVQKNKQPVYFRQKIGIGDGTNFGNFRKPGPGMINFLIDFYQSTPEETLFVSDRQEDEGAAQAAGTKFMAADIVRGYFSPGCSELRATDKQLKFLESGLKGELCE